MNVAEWILVGFLSVALLVFIIVGIIALVKWNHLVDETRKIVDKGQDIAATTNDIAENIKGITSFGNVIKAVSNNITKSFDSEPEPRKKQTKEKK